MRVFEECHNPLVFIKSHRNVCYLKYCCLLPFRKTEIIRVADAKIRILTLLLRTMALGSTQPLTEMSTRNISWGVNAAGAYG
jgi:hypothetical protein